MNFLRCVNLSKYLREIKFIFWFTRCSRIGWSVRAYSHPERKRERKRKRSKNFFCFSFRFRLVWKGLKISNERNLFRQFSKALLELRSVVVVKIDKNTRFGMAKPFRNISNYTSKNLDHHLKFARFREKLRNFEWYFEWFDPLPLPQAKSSVFFLAFLFFFFAGGGGLSQIWSYVVQEKFSLLEWAGGGGGGV